MGVYKYIHTYESIYNVYTHICIKYIYVFGCISIYCLKININNKSEKYLLLR